MKKKVFLQADSDGVLLEYNADQVSILELQSEIEKIISSPRVKKLTDKRITELIEEYDVRVNSKIDGDSDLQELQTIQSLLYAAKAYWEEQGIDYRDTSALIDVLNDLHPDWGLKIKEECLAVSIW